MDGLSDEFKNWADKIIIPSHKEVVMGYRVCPIHKHVHIYLCSPFVIALALTFIDGF